VSSETNSSALALSLYRRMLRIRLVEEAIADEYPKQEMKCPVHLYIGQEAVAAGVSECLRDTDTLISTHRSHGHYLAKMGALRPFFAELYGRATGSSEGKGGSMHLLDIERGYLGSSAIVGGNIPMVAGLALAHQFRGGDQIAVAYFGDGACEEGVLYETLNFAALKKLPMLFVCENNLFATLTRFEERQPRDNIFLRAREFGVESARVDGNDAFAVHEAALAGVNRARSGAGPFFLEALTYRWRTHCGPQWDTPSAVRPTSELEYWKEKCPLLLLRKFLGAHGVASLLAEMEREIRAEIADAFAFAKSSPAPAPESLLEDVLV
jgi:acetoin:2,6-dichlorophenolindophenol oxidoreductase subunit alpha